MDVIRLSQACPSMGNIPGGAPRAGLDGKGLGSNPHAPAHAILNRYVWFVAKLKHCMVCFVTADITTLYINSLMQIFAKPVFNSLLPDFT